MGLFFPDDDKQFFPGRKTGFARYKEVLEGSYKEFFLVGFIALLFMIPFAAGMVYAILSSSALVALGAGIAGGAIAGPGLACLYDIILRRLRDDNADWWVCFKRSMAQNWRAAILPGIVQCLFLGFFVFSAVLILWAQAAPTLGTLLLLVFSALLCVMMLSVWWPQVVLFDQRPGIQLKNCVFFMINYFRRTLGAGALQAAWWLIMALFLPWTAFVVPILGLWYILFVSLFLLYDSLDEAFRIEEQIQERFPERVEKKEER